MNHGDCTVLDAEGDDRLRVSDILHLQALPVTFLFSSSCLASKLLGVSVLSASKMT